MPYRSIISSSSSESDLEADPCLLRRTWPQPGINPSTISDSEIDSDSDQSEDKKEEETPQPELSPAQESWTCSKYHF